MSKRPSIALIGGTFGDEPKKSTIIQSMFSNIELADDIYQWKEVLYVNGGYLDELPRILENLGPYDIILWFPNVSNDAPKMRNVKELYPHKCLVISKRNEGGKYSLRYMVNQALQLHANLCVEFTPKEKGFQGRVFDPLGNVWCDYTYNIASVTWAILQRVQQLSIITRENVTQCGDYLKTPDAPEFFTLVKEYAKTFHTLVDPEKEVKRFLGNSSFRCNKGFPSFRSDWHSDVIFVSRRNIDKEFIDKAGFVGTTLGLDGKGTYFYGENKPSVDTPIQLRLYQYYKNINYMIHSHTYIEGAPTTLTHFPCGSLQEVDEIIKLIPDENVEVAFINLLGHGSLVMSKTVEDLKDIPYIRRPAPEILG